MGSWPGSLFSRTLALLGGSGDSLVRRDLTDLKDATNKFGQVALRPCSSHPKGQLTSGLKTIDAHFEDAIEDLSTPKGQGTGERPGPTNNGLERQVSAADLVLFHLPRKTGLGTISKVNCCA